MKPLLLAFVLAASSSLSLAGTPPKGISDPVTYLPGLGIVAGKQYAGRLPVAHDGSGKDFLFHWFVETASSTPELAPVVVWLNGGPGCSSMTGFFEENGPYFIDDNTTLSLNPNSWHSIAHLLYIDQPVGTGLSYVEGDDEGKEIKEQDRNEHVIAHNMHHVIRLFFEKHPEYSHLPLYIFGESYAGKYIPHLAKYVLDANKKSVAQGKPMMNLKGVGIGDGLVHPIDQRFVYGTLAHATGLLDSFQLSQLDYLSLQCKALIMEKKWRKGGLNCDLSDFVSHLSGGVSNYDIRTTKDSYSQEDEVSYLNNPEFRKAVHVDALPVLKSTCSDTVMDFMQGERVKSSREILPELMAGGVRVLLYSGQFDLIDGPLGTERYMDDLQWDGAEEWASAERRMWRHDGDVAGYTKEAGMLVAKVF
eukprot:comp21475_c0_seq2/m.29729 comp21475_c0_seq2/g.29729  ORF comp21475_c0_seq2/g.29729 comp21475_c0_seq2/m.29729 type:complete len:419 (-) comp21475_c0_seq2:5-1261(-)